MDMSELGVERKSNDGVWVHLQNVHTKKKLYADSADLKDDPDKPMRILILGLDGKEAKRFEAANKKQAKGAKVEEDGVYIQSDSIDDVRDYNFNMCVALTAGWENIVVDGVELEFNKSQVRKLYLRFPDIMDCVFDVMKKRANFIEGPSDS